MLVRLSERDIRVIPLAFYTFMVLCNVKKHKRVKNNKAYVTGEYKRGAQIHLVRRWARWSLDTFKERNSENMSILYDFLKVCVSIIFNVLNKVLAGRMPPLGSATVVVEEEDRYLVVMLPRKRVVFPGGFMTWRETPQQAAEREGKEETGLILQADSFLAFYPLVSTGWHNMSTTCFAYHAHVVGGALSDSIEGRACWMHVGELRKRLTGHSINILDDYLLYRERLHNASSKQLDNQEEETASPHIP